ncbi:MAG: FHA domain-containing protein, partial [Thermoanaerobaculia bacterium]
PSSFILHPSSFILHPSDPTFRPDLPAFILHPSSFILYHPADYRTTKGHSMKVLLLAGGVLFLLLALGLFIAAVVVFFIGRNRRAKAAAPPQAYVPPQPQAAPPPAPAPAPAADPNATVVVDTRNHQSLGAMHGISGALAGRVFPIDAAGFTIGRDRTQAQVVIENPSVSKRHVWIGVRDGVVMAVDQQSTNGTYVDGTTGRIGEARLSPGDTLIISDDVARLVYRA